MQGPSLCNDVNNEDKPDTPKRDITPAASDVGDA